MSFIEIVEGKNSEELDALIKAAEAAKESAKSRDLDEFAQLVEQVKAKAETLGLNVKSFFTEKKDYVDKYVNPANTNQKWSGCGPTPAWMKALFVGLPKEDWKEAKKKYLIQ